MSEFKVGDFVKILHTDYHNTGLDVGTVHKVKFAECGYVDLESLGPENAGHGLCFYDKEVEIALSPVANNTLTPGQTYTMASGRKMRVIHLEGGKAFGVFLSDNGSANLNSAYTWDMEGTYQNAIEGVRDEYRIVFEPVRETVTCGVNFDKGRIWSGMTGPGNRKAKITLETVNGEPDWTTAKVEAAR